MKNIFRLFLLLLFTIFRANSFGQQNFDKAAYYEVMASDKVEAIDSELVILKKSTSGLEAFEGALLMKKAGLAKKGKDKIDLFKAGRKKLEAAIKSDPGNVEWRFLRLMIQENAPKAVNYKSDLEADSKLITNNYKSLSPVVQKAVNGYSKNSKILNSKDF